MTTEEKSSGINPPDLTDNEQGIEDTKKKKGQDRGEVRIYYLNEKAEKHLELKKEENNIK